MYRNLFKHWLSVLVLTGIFVPQVQAEISSEHYQLVSRMGELNGVALSCRYFQQTKKIKAGLIASLPKRRELGQVFDDKTNESFLAFVQAQSSCPSPAEFSVEVDKALEALSEGFAQ